MWRRCCVSRRTCNSTRTTRPGPRAPTPQQRAAQRQAMGGPGAAAVATDRLVVRARGRIALALSLATAGCIAYHEVSLPRDVSAPPTPATPAGLRAGFGR